MKESTAQQIKIGEAVTYKDHGVFWIESKRTERTDQGEHTTFRLVGVPHRVSADHVDPI